MSQASAAAVERVARVSYGRLLAILASRAHDLAAAEDALGEAFAQALSKWPISGVPAQPEAWLLTVSRRNLIDAHRHDKVAAAASASLALLLDELIETKLEATFPDERLRLMFACAHPALEHSIRTALMLQCVLGLEVARIASAFLTAPATLAQRLVRAKRKIRAAGIPFEVPGSDELPARLDDVLDGIYGAYGTGWDDADGADPRIAGLSREAVELAEAVVSLLPEAAEARGLLALLLFCEARRAARRNADGAYVPLSEQDTRRWQHADIARADALLVTTANRATLGPFQLEAAIQSAHCQARLGVTVPAAALLALYDGLLVFRPRLGARLGRLSVLAQVAGAQTALAALEELPSALVSDHQPYWALRAHLLAEAGQAAAARTAYERAAALATHSAVREFLSARAARSDAR